MIGSTTVLCFCDNFILMYMYCNFQSGPFVKLQLGLETSVYVDTEPPTHCFCPCAHMASEKTIQ